MVADLPLAASDGLECSVDGCRNPRRNRTAAYCKKHYHRWYRHGSVDVTARETSVTASLGRRYRSLSRPSHPLAAPSGRVYEHRMVLFDRIGPGKHMCHWCPRVVVWRVASLQPDDLVPDHLNNDGADNRPENLVPSCRDCNGARGAQRRSDALRDAGWWSEHDTIERLSKGGRRPRVEPSAS